MPGILITGAYNQIAFGNPLVTGYAPTTSIFPGMHRHGSGLAASYSHIVPLPKLQALWGMSLSPYRGMFFLSPFLLLAFPGFWLWARRGGREWILFLGIVILHFIAISAFPGWHGGWAVGPRYLIAMLPFIAFPIIFILDFAADWLTRLVVYGLLGLSFFAVWVETLGGPAYPPNSFFDPLFSYSLPALSHWYLRASVVTLGMFLGVIPNDISLSDVLILALIGFISLLSLWSWLWWSLGNAATSRQHRRRTSPDTVQIAELET